MSWDASFAEDCWNYTHNCNAMICEAMRVLWPDEEPEKHWLIGHMGGSWFHHLDGMNAAEGYEFLKSVCDELELRPRKYGRMNPPNGWGDYRSLVRMLREMQEASKQGSEEDIWSVRG